MLRLWVLLILLSFGCQTGRIPCPKPKAAKAAKAGKRYANSFPAKIEPKEITARRSRAAKSEDQKFTKSVSVEEWDCPEPGSRKYLPRNVKENIRRNTRKIQQDMGNNSSDSTAVQP